MKNLLPFITTILFAFNSYSQEQHLVDSLTTQLNHHNTTKLELNIKSPSLYDTTAANILYLLSIAYWGNDPVQSMKYAEQCLTLSEQIDFKKGIGNAYNSMGGIYEDKSDYLIAIEYYNKSLKIRKEIADKKGIAAIYNNIGIIYYYQGNYSEALRNYFAALKMNEESGNKNFLAINLENIGDVYVKQGNYSEALKILFAALKIMEEIGNKKELAFCYDNIGLIYTEQGKDAEALTNHFAALKIREEIGDKQGIATSYCNIGNIYLKQGNESEALKNHFAALKLQEEIGEKKGIANSYNNIAEIYTNQKKYKDALEYLNKGLAIANEIKSLELIKNNYKYSSKLYSAQGNFNKALEHYKLFITYRDSLVNNESTQKTVALQMNYDFRKQQDSINALQAIKDAGIKTELEKQKLIRNTFIGGFMAMLLFAGIFYQQRNKISKARKRSDELLLNILPEEVAEELKQKGGADAKQFDDVTVMFTDFKGFTQISEKLSPTELVNEIHTCFKAFDEIIGKHNIEKIKTIGDSYMCAGGLPVANTTNAFDVVKAAIEIQQFMFHHLEEKKRQGQELFEIRIGINTGPVVAGIVGVKKFAYDIWGDTVNTASRMESSGEAGKINISSSTYELVKDKFTCIHRGKIPAKNKGEIEMYFVEGQI